MKVRDELLSLGTDPSNLVCRVAMGFGIWQFHGVFFHTFEYDSDFTFALSEKPSQVKWRGCPKKREASSNSIKIVSTNSAKFEIHKNYIAIFSMFIIKHFPIGKIIVSKRTWNSQL